MILNKLHLNFGIKNSTYKLLKKLNLFFLKKI